MRPLAASSSALALSSVLDFPSVAIERRRTRRCTDGLGGHVLGRFIGNAVSPVEVWVVTV